MKELIIMLMHRLRTAACLMTLFILLSFTSDPATSAAPRGGSQRFVLVIDAGHGGKDNGASGKISKEKNINLNIALAFGRMVEANCPDVKVVYTRKGARTLPTGTKPTSSFRSTPTRCRPE